MSSFPLSVAVSFCSYFQRNKLLIRGESSIIKRSMSNLPKYAAYILMMRFLKRALLIIQPLQYRKLKTAYRKRHTNSPYLIIQF